MGACTGDFFALTKYWGESTVAVKVTLYLLLANLKLLSVSLQKLVPHRISSGLYCSEEAALSSSIRGGCMSTNFCGLGGFSVSVRRNKDILIDLCACTLYGTSLIACKCASSFDTRACNATIAT